MTQDERDKLLIRAAQAAGYRAKVTKACGIGMIIGVVIYAVVAGIIALTMSF